MTTLDLLHRAWELDPFAITVIGFVLAFYAVYVRRVGAAVSLRRALLVVLAVVALVIALISPVAVLARGYLFSAHMIQHLLLVLVVPPLLLTALPRQAAASRLSASSASSASSAPRGPIAYLAPWLLGVGAMWVWHAPTLCDAASRSTGMLRVQTLSLVGMGAAFWWPIAGPQISRRFTAFSAMVYLFTACTACTILGILVTFSPVQVCAVYTHPVDTLGALSLVREGWGVTPKIDQEIGGLMMWVPGCLVYALSILLMYARYSRDDVATSAAPHASHEQEPAPSHARAEEAP